MQTGSYEGKQGHIRDLKTPEIEVFENVYSDKDYSIQLEFPEFTAICPKTGLPDFGIFTIVYTPDAWCLELKSLKEYFLYYRDVGIFHENVTNRVMDDILKACSPRKLSVTALYNVRGGITTTVTRSYPSDGK